MMSEISPCMTDQQHVSIKNSLFHSIKKNDLERVKKMMRLFQIEPSEEISTFGNLWTPIHYAIFFKSAKILEFLIQLTYQKYKNNIENYISILNMQTKSGHSPLMVAAVYDTVDCLKVLFHYGGLQLSKKDLSAMDCIKLALKYNSIDANNYIQDKIAQNGFMDFLKVNEEAFKVVPDLKTLLHQRYEVVMNEEDIIKNRDLLLYGEPINCIICLQNTGFLKYSNCCGQPLHQHCHAERIIQCPLCKSNNFYLISEVLHPNRAFTFDPNDDYINIQNLDNKDKLNNVNVDNKEATVEQETIKNKISTEQCDLNLETSSKDILNVDTKHNTNSINNKININYSNISTTNMTHTQKQNEKEQKRQY